MFRVFKVLLLLFAIASFAMMPVTNAIADELKVEAKEGVKEDKFKEFFVTLVFDEVKTIAEAGPFEVYVECIEDEITIGITSSVDGWTVGSGIAPGEILTTDDVEGFEVSADAGELRFENIDDRIVAIGPDDDGDFFYVSLEGKTMGLGLNFFGHNCLAVGIVSLMKLDMNLDDD